MARAPFEPAAATDTPRHTRLLAVVIGLTAILLVLAGVLAYRYFTREPARRGASPVTKVVGGTRSTLLKDPLAIALYNGKFYVTDAGHSRVVVFLENGEPLFSFRGGGPHDLRGSRLVYPNGIGVNSRGEVYVADSGSGEVVVFSESGRALRLLKLPGRGKAVLRPLAVHVDDADSVFINEASSGNLYQLNRNERVVQTVGGGKLSYANGIATAKNGDIYVADSNKQRLVVFDQFGKLLRYLGQGEQNQSFLPRGLAFDKRGDLLVADTLGSRIVELNDMGHLMEHWGSPGSGREQLSFPNGLAYERGLLYVVDRGNNRVVIWQHLP